MLPVISEAELRKAITPADAVSVVREAFRADGLGLTTVPAPIGLEIPGTRGEFHVKTAHVTGMPYIAVKIASGFYDNPRLGLPTGAGLMALFDSSTGMPAALLLDNGYLTDVRTGAAGAVAAEALARTDLETVGVIGSGVQARQQVWCLREVRRFRRVVAWSPDPEGLAAYCREIASTLGIESVPASTPEAVVAAADIVITVTPARAPLVKAEWLRPGQHVTAVGSDGPGKQELDARCLSVADLVVTDRTSQCARLGELQHAIAAGLMTVERVHAQLGEILAGARKGRSTPEQVTIADLTGVGFQDTAIACAAFASVWAHRQGLGPGPWDIRTTDSGTDDFGRNTP